MADWDFCERCGDEAPIHSYMIEGKEEFLCEDCGKEALDVGDASGA